MASEAGTTGTKFHCRLSGFQEKRSYSRCSYYRRSYHCPDEKKIALEHLDFAIKEFREMKMQPSNYGVKE